MMLRIGQTCDMAEGGQLFRVKRLCFQQTGEMSELAFALLRRGARNGRNGVPVCDLTLRRKRETSFCQAPEL